MKISNRTEKLRQKLAEEGLEAILISQAYNRGYLSGFRGTAGYLLITPREAVLATDFRYTEQARLQAPDYQILQISGNGFDWLSRLAAEMSLKRVGFEARGITFAGYRQLSEILKEKTGLQLVPTESLVESLRLIKEPEEIALISRAAVISDRACGHIRDKIRAGMTEMEIAWELESYLRENGSQALPFEIIVASGPNAALPHAQPTPRRINPGEPVLIDMGAKINGYSSDLSRTICLGKPDDTFKKVYDTVLGAQLCAIAMIAEGMSGNEADSLARTVIAEGGYADAFGHSLGHGVGLEPHEAPRLGPGSTDKLTSGTVFTIEPGIYLPGWGGVRIEDLVMMDRGKIKVLSKAPK